MSDYVDKDNLVIRRLFVNEEFFNPLKSPNTDLVRHFIKQKKEDEHILGQFLYFVSSKEYDGEDFTIGNRKM